MNAVWISVAIPIHGSDLCFRTLSNAAAFSRVGVLIMGGDLTSNTIVPLQRPGTGEYTFRWQSSKLRVSAAALPAAGERATRPQDPEIVVCASITRRLNLTEGWLPGTGIECYIVPGSDNLPAIDRMLARGGLIINPEGRLVCVRDRREMIPVRHDETGTLAQSTRTHGRVSRVQAGGAGPPGTLPGPGHRSSACSALWHRYRPGARRLGSNRKPGILPGDVHRISAEVLR